MKMPTWAVLVLLIASLAHAQSTPVLVSQVSTAEYFGEVYAETPSPGSSYVFFPGEPVAISIAVVNRSTDTQLVNWSGSAGTASLVSLGATRDSVSVPFPVEFVGAFQGRAFGSSFAVAARDTYELAPGERVERRLVSNQTLRPGSYVVRAVAAATDRSGREVFPQVVSIRFEVRPSRGYEAEVFRRDGLRKVFANDIPGANAAIAELRAVNPESYEASLIEAKVARLVGRTSDADQLESLAVDQVKQGRDRLLLRFMRPDQLKDLADRLSMKRR